MRTEAQVVFILYPKPYRSTPLASVILCDSSKWLPVFPKFPDLSPNSFFPFFLPELGKQPSPSVFNTDCLPPGSKLPLPPFWAHLSQWNVWGSMQGSSRRSCAHLTKVRCSVMHSHVITTTKHNYNKTLPVNIASSGLVMSAVWLMPCWCSLFIYLFIYFIYFFICCLTLQESGGRRLDKEETAQLTVWLWAHFILP